jgi:hypothetical protein
MMNVRHLAALFVVALLSACGGGMQVGGGPEPDSLTGMMLEPNPSEGDEIDDAVGTQIP